MNLWCKWSKWSPTLGWCSIDHRKKKKHIPAGFLCTRIAWLIWQGVTIRHPKTCWEFGLRKDHQSSTVRLHRSPDDQFRRESEIVENDELLFAEKPRFARRATTSPKKKPHLKAGKRASAANWLCSCVLISWVSKHQTRSEAIVFDSDTNAMHL